MTKRTFLKKLKEKLVVLEPEEIEDIIKEYSDHIDVKVKEGKTEKEAVEDFGDVDLLAKEILTAYKVRGNNDENKFEKFITRLIDDVGDFFSKFMDNVEKQDISKLVMMGIYFVIGLFLLSILLFFVRLPFDMIRNITLSITDMMGDGVFVTGIQNILVFFINAALVIFSFVLVIVFLKKGINYFYQNEAEIEKNVEKLKPIIEKVKEKEKIKKSENSVMEVFVILLKIFVVFSIFLPLIMSLIGLFVALGVLVFFFIQGVTSIGLLLILLGLIVIGFAILDIVWKFLTTKGGVK